MEEDPGERTPALGGSGGPSLRAHSSSPRRVPLFERASARWWNPQFRSPSLEAQYWKCSFPQLRFVLLSASVLQLASFAFFRDRFRTGLVYISFVCVAWTIYLAIFDKAGFQHWVREKGEYGEALIRDQSLSFSLPSIPFSLIGKFDVTPMFPADCCCSDCGVSGYAVFHAVLVSVSAVLHADFVPLHLPHLSGHAPDILVGLEVDLHDAGRQPRHQLPGSRIAPGQSHEGAARPTSPFAEGFYEVSLHANRWVASH